MLPLARLGIDVAERLGAIVMLPGDVYNFGPQMPARLGESTPQQPSTRKGLIRCELEALLEARSHGGLRSVVLRAGFAGQARCRTTRRRGCHPCALAPKFQARQSSRQSETLH
jgi:hypothetical protein